MTTDELQRRASDGAISGTEWEAVTRELATRKRDGGVAAPPPSVAAPARPVAVGPMRVVVTDFDMPFLSMVNFILKWTLASIPALMILAVLAFALVFAFSLARGTGL